MYEIGQKVRMVDPMLIDKENGIFKNDILTVYKPGVSGEYGFYAMLNGAPYFILNHQVKEVSDVGE